MSASPQLCFGLACWAALAVLPPPAFGDPPEPPVIEADEVTVTSTRTERRALRTAGNVTRIDREDIERSGANTLPDLLRREAGLYVTNNTGTPEGFTVEARGFNNGGGNGCSTLVLVDGRRLNEPDTGCPDWSFVFLDDVESVEIVRGPASALYGDNAAAGVIQIETRRPAEGQARAAGHGSTGSWGSQEGSGLVDAEADGVWAQAFFDHSDTNGYRERSGFDADASKLAVGWDLDALGELRLDAGYTSTFRERPGTLTAAEVREDRRQADPDSFGDFDDARERYLRGTLEVAPTEDLTVRFVPYARRRTDDARLSGDDGASGFDFTTGTETEQVGLDGQAEAAFEAFGKRHTLVVGGEARYETSDIDSAFRSMAFGDNDTDIELERVSWGLFLQQELVLHEDWRAYLGARRDVVQYDGRGRIVDAFGGSGIDVDDEHDVWSPSASLVWQVMEPVSAYVSYARGFRSANLNEAVRFFEGEVDPLDPQRSESYEVGAKLRGDRTSANLALYWMNVKDELLFDPFTFSNRNLDRVQHRGVELSGSVRPTDWLELYVSYTYEDVTIERGEPAAAGRIPLTPEHRGSAGALVDLPYGFEVGVDGRWVGDRPLVNDLDNSSDSLPSYDVYDARIAWRGEYEGITLRLEAVGRNLFDEEYEEFGGESAFGPPGFYPSPERNYTLGFRLELRR